MDGGSVDRRGVLVYRSTSFANPAITIARSLTDTFSGIRSADAPGFIAAQLIGALAGLGVATLLFPAPASIRIGLNADRVGEATVTRKAEA